MIRMTTMTNLPDHESFSDQELILLFRQYLPVQPLPAELAAKITLLVLSEVATSLKRQTNDLRWPSPVVLRNVFKAWFRR
jgi:hypothetical protein